MPLTEEQTRLAVIIDTHVREVLAHGTLQAVARRSIYRGL
jgi:hypothetical protein